MCIEPKNALNKFCETILLLCIIKKGIKTNVKNVKRVNDLIVISKTGKQLHLKKIYYIK